jgi:acetate kinase
MDTILVVNAGSSSVKFQLFGIAPVRELKRLIKGQVTGIGTAPHLRAENADGTPLVDEIYRIAHMPDVPAALHQTGLWLRDTQKVSPVAIGHRVVHGGPDYSGPVMIDDAVLAKLARYEPLAPLHQPNNLAPILSIRARFPDLPQVACFDTAFHRGRSPIADHYAIPEELYAEGVRRYGFHGLSYEYVASRLPQVAPDLAGGRVIVAHLGNDASMCALNAGRSIESTMGFTTLDGLPMGTRPGQIDPGVILYLLQRKRMSSSAVQKLLYTGCGLKGLSGLSSDVRELEASWDPRAALALDHFAYRVGLNAAMLAAALGGLDGFVFTGGVGEHSPSMRTRIARHLEWLGVELDAAANMASAGRISAAASRVAVYLVPTDEELMVARHTLELLAARLGRQSEKARIA